MSQAVKLHVVLIDVGTYDFLSICHNSSNFDAKLLLFRGSIVVVFTTFNNAVQLFCVKFICIYQKKAVILQPETENDSPTEHFWFDF